MQLCLLSQLFESRWRPNPDLGCFRDSVGSFCQLLDALFSLPFNCAPVMEQVAFVKSGDGPRPRRNEGNKKAPCLSDDQMKRVRMWSRDSASDLRSAPGASCPGGPGLPSWMITDVPCGWNQVLRTSESNTSVHQSRRQVPQAF